MARRKPISLKKPPVRKRRANTLQANDNKPPSYFSAAAAKGREYSDGECPCYACVQGTQPEADYWVSQYDNAVIKLNKPKPPERQRPEPMTESLLDLLKPSSPSPPESQLPESLNNIPPPDFSSSRRRPVGRESSATFSQMFVSESLSLMGGSQSPCSFRSSQSEIAARMRASMTTQPDSQLTP